MDECGLLCHLGIIDQGNAYYILKIESPATISVRSHEGKSLSLYRSGISKCLLAWQPASVQASIIDDLQWERATPTTITDAQQLREELGRIRARGWSFDNGEDYPDVRCVAAPVFNANNDLTAAISVVGTRLQINEDNRDYLAGKAIACAKDISVCWGGKPLRTTRLIIRRTSRPYRKLNTSAPGSSAAPRQSRAPAAAITTTRG